MLVYLIAYHNGIAERNIKGAEAAAGRVRPAGPEAAGNGRPRERDRDRADAARRGHDLAERVRPHQVEGARRRLSAYCRKCPSAAWYSGTSSSVTGPLSRRGGVGSGVMSIPPVLRTLLTAPGPSGLRDHRRRGLPRRRARASPTTCAATSWAARPRACPARAAGRTLAVVGHIDEIGLIVTHIEDTGFLRFIGVGGWDPQVLIGQRVELATQGGHRSPASSARSRST